MKTLIAIALATTTMLGVATAADARDGCGPGGHRGPYGHCRPNYGGPVVVGPRVGVFYPGRGYWHDGRYWHHRYRYGHDWRYR